MKSKSKRYWETGREKINCGKNPYINWLLIKCSQKAKDMEIQEKAADGCIRFLRIKFIQ